MSIIQLDCNLLSKFVEINSNSRTIAIARRLETANDILKSGGSQEVLLLQAQFLACKLKMKRRW